MRYSELENIVRFLTGLSKSKLRRFLHAELLLYVAHRLGEERQAKDLYLLLQNRELMVQTEFTRDDIRLRNLRWYLGNERMHDTWQMALEIYCDPSVEDAALFGIDDERDCFYLKTPEDSATQNRLNLYDQLLDTVLREDGAQIMIAKPGETLKCKLAASETGTVNVKIPESIPSIGRPETISKVGGVIDIDWETVITTAREMDLLTGKRYREDVLRKSRFMDGHGILVEQIHIEGVTNLLGQVGAGKSTFADPLAVALARRGMRIVCIESTLPKVCEKAELFRKVGVRAVGIFSHLGESRRNQANSLERGNDYFKSALSDMLHTGCPLQSFVTPPETVITIGAEPCFSLISEAEESRRVCPFYGSCPTTKKDSDLLEANIIVTTSAGLAALRYDAQHKLLLKYVVANTDLVIVDESDEVQGQLDGLFSHALEANEYLRDCAEFQQKYVNLSMTDKAEPIKQQCYSHLTHFTDELALICRRVEERSCGFSPTQLKAFTSLRLITVLKERKADQDVPLSDEDYDILCNLASGILSDRQKRVLLSVTDDTIQLASHLEVLALCREERYADPKTKDEWLEENRDKFRRLQESVYFILLVIAFERSYDRILNLVSANPELDGSLTRIIKQNFREQQRLLPAACATGALTMEYREGDDLYIKQQYLTGRALLYALPYLGVDSDCKASGPNVLLMSGTSLCPGSRTYHIPKDVDYIIEAPEEKRRFLEKTQFFFPATETCISGVADDRKIPELKKLLKEQLPIIKECLADGENILMTTNSYAQAQTVCAELKRLLPGTEMGCVIPDREELKPSIVRLSEVASFKGRILVTPTLVMERGHNIVDVNGNAHFHTLMLLVRPLANPNDFAMHLRKINGAMFQRYYGKYPHCGLSLCLDIRKQAYALSYRLKESRSMLELSEEDQKDIMVSLFVTIIQLIGRISRINDPGLALRPPKVYFLDGAFQSSRFDYRKFLPDYLQELMEDEKYGFAAKTLYESYYNAIVRGIYGKEV